MMKISEMPKYDDYVDSGVEWLGRVPSHWQIIRLKNTINGCVNGLWGADPNGKDELVVVRVSDFDEQKLNVSDEKLTYRSIPENERKSRLLKFGDLLIEKSGGGDKTLVGRVVLFDKSYTAVTSNFVAKMTPKNWVNHSFLKYVFFSLYSRGVNYVSIKQTTGIQNLDANSYLNEVFCFPDEFVQAEVANFLDKKTALIDEAISIKEQQISLLKERKQIIIQQAVTQGLDPNVPMKDSGVDWIGKVPAHWEVKKMKFIFDSIQTGTTPVTSEPKYFDGDVDWYNPKDLNAGYLDKSEKTISELAIKHGQAKIFPGDSVLIVGIGATCGKTAYLKSSSAFNQQITGFSSRHENAEFMYYLISMYSSVMLKVANYTTLPILNNEFFKHFLLPCPSKIEQDRIVGFLRIETLKFEKTIEIQLQQIERLKEYKTTLINSAVTGKIKITPEMVEQ